MYVGNVGHSHKSVAIAKADWLVGEVVGLLHYQSQFSSIARRDIPSVSEPSELQVGVMAKREHRRTTDTVYLELHQRRRENHLQLSELVVVAKGKDRGCSLLFPRRARLLLK